VTTLSGLGGVIQTIRVVSHGEITGKVGRVPADLQGPLVAYGPVFGPTSSKNTMDDHLARQLLGSDQKRQENQF